MPHLTIQRVTQVATGTQHNFGIVLSPHDRLLVARVLNQTTGWSKTHIALARENDNLTDNSVALLPDAVHCGIRDVGFACFPDGLLITDPYRYLRVTATDLAVGDVVILTVGVLI